jgi:hypothetical protein
MTHSPGWRLLAGSVAVLAVTAFVAACGDDDDAATTTGSAASTTDTTDRSQAGTPDRGSVSGEEADYVAALRRNVSLDDEEMSTCLAQAVVDAVGFDRIEASGLSPDEFANSGGDLGESGQALTPDQRDELKAAFADCGDIVGALTNVQRISDEQKNCVRSAISNDMAAEIIANQWTNAENSQQVVEAQGEASACIDDAAGDGATTTTAG